MRIAPQAQPRGTPENVIPMINVVFLLLVFFLITARIAPPLPVEIEAPAAEGQEIDADPEALIVAPDGTLHYGGLTDEAALERLGERPEGDTVLLRADRTMPASELAAVLRQVGETVPVQLELVVEN